MAIVGQFDSEDIVEENTLNTKEDTSSNRALQHILDEYEWWCAQSKGDHEYNYKLAAKMVETTPINKFTLDAFVEKTSLRGNQIFLSALIQRAYECGENNFVFSATNKSNWNHSISYFGHKLKGTKENPLRIKTHFEKCDTSDSFIGVDYVHVALHNSVSESCFFNARDSTLVVHGNAGKDLGSNAQSCVIKAHRVGHRMGKGAVNSRFFAISVGDSTGLEAKYSHFIIAEDGHCSLGEHSEHSTFEVGFVKGNCGQGAHNSSFIIDKYALDSLGLGAENCSFVIKYNLTQQEKEEISYAVRNVCGGNARACSFEINGPVGRQCGSNAGGSQFKINGSVGHELGSSSHGSEFEFHGVGPLKGEGKITKYATAWQAKESTFRFTKDPSNYVGTCSYESSIGQSSEGCTFYLQGMKLLGYTARQCKTGTFYLVEPNGSVRKMTTAYDVKE